MATTASKIIPQTLPEIPTTPEPQQYTKTAPDIPKSNNSRSSVPKLLQESDRGKLNHKLEPKEQKPNHHLKESVDVSSAKCPTGVSEEMVSEGIASQEKKVVEYESVNGSSTSFHTCEGSGPGKASGSARMTDRSETGERGSSSRCRPSTSSDISDESSCSSMSSTTKPHKSNDSRWEAIQTIRVRDGIIGLSHFRLLKKLGCGDIGSVYLSELSGAKSYFAMKVMDKASLASRKKLLRAQTEKEILQCLDHPFLPTLYTHFETDKFSCLVMEFCPGGDLHTLRQRQPGKYFPEQAVKYVFSPFLSKICLSPFYLLHVLHHLTEMVIFLKLVHVKSVVTNGKSSLL